MCGMQTFDTLFNGCNDLSTFMLLDHTGIYGVSIGINKESKSIITNSNVWIHWNAFKVKFNGDEIERYQNLDFKGNENLLNNNYKFINNNFKNPCQQIAMVDLEKLSKSKILSYFIGQFILLDYDTDYYLPIYVYTPTIIRSNQHIVVLSDIVRYVNHTPMALIHKDNIENTQNYVSITTTNCAIEKDWNLQNAAPNILPNLDNVPISNINGAMTDEQSRIINNAMNNAENHVSDC